MIYPYFDTDISYTGTVIGHSVGGWDDVGGIYHVQLDNGRRFHCSENAMVAYWEKQDESK